MQDIDDAEIVCYDIKIYVPQSMYRSVIDWYHFYLDHTSGSRLAKEIRYVCYWKYIVMQAGCFAKTCKICQQFKMRKILYGHLPPNHIAELKTWDSVREDLIGP